MAARPIREVQGLNIVYKHINSDKNENGGLEPVKYFAVENAEDLANAETNHPWILQEVSTIILYSFFEFFLIKVFRKEVGSNSIKPKWTSEVVFRFF